MPRRRLTLGAVTLLAVLLNAATCPAPTPSPTAHFPPAGVPIIETVYVPPLNAGQPGRVTSVSWLGLLPVQPADSIVLRLRAPWPSDLSILVNGQKLPRIPDASQPPTPDDAGFFKLSVTPMPGNLPGPAAAWFSWTATVKLPKSVRFQGLKPIPAFVLTMRDTSLENSFTGTDKQAPDLNLGVPGFRPPFCAGPGCDPPPATPPPPSEVFLSGENSKNDTQWPHMPRATLGIVSRQVTLAGWLEGPGRNNDSLPPHASEDWHYSLILDPDFITRNYVLGNSEPLAQAVLPGQPEQQACWTVNPSYGCPCALPGCAYKIPFSGGRAPDVGMFMLPGESDMTVELNAWHKSARGSPPMGWVADPNPDRPDPSDSSAPYSDNAWAFPVTVGTVFPPHPSHELQAGDYVIVTGTLWQDVAHLVSTPDPIRRCYDSIFPGHGGWLEIHPPDVVRWVSPPPDLRKHVELVTVCSPTGSGSLHKTLAPDGPPRDERSVLRFKEIVDPRFTDASSVTLDQVAVNRCDPTKLDVSVGVNNVNGRPAYFKSVVLVWWEESDSPRPAPDPACSAGPTDTGQCLADCQAEVSECMHTAPVDPKKCAAGSKACIKMCSSRTAPEK